MVNLPLDLIHLHTEQQRLKRKAKGEGCGHKKSIYRRRTGGSHINETILIVDDEPCRGNDRNCEFLDYTITISVVLSKLRYSQYITSSVIFGLLPVYLN